MTNLPITISPSQPPARGADSQLSRSGSPAASTNAAAGAARKNDSANDQPADPFGAVLARRIQADEANTAAPTAPPASGIDAKTTADSAATTGKTEQDKTLATVMTGDQSSALAAMLQLPQEIKSPIAKDVTAGTTARGVTDVVATAQGVVDTVATARGIAGATMLREASANKAGVTQSAANAGTIKAKMSLADAAPGKVDAAAMIADNLTVVDKSALRNGSGLEVATPVEVFGSFPDAARSAQGLAQSAASVAASGMLPNMLVSDKTANNLQTVSAPLGSSGWADEFSQKITWMGTQQNQVAELHLNPPNLGPLDVVLKISDNQATALFTSPHSAVRDAVENALPRLREMLADNGIMLGNTMVSDQPPRDRNANGFMEHGAGAPVQRETSDDALRISSTTAQVVPARRHNGMVDTFA